MVKGMTYGKGSITLVATSTKDVLYHWAWNLIQNAVKQTMLKYLHSIKC